MDTSGYAPELNFQRLLPYVDVFLFDLKIADPESHKKYIGKDNALILSNLEFLSRRGAKINLRLPLIKGVNADQNHISSVIAYLKEKNINTYQANLLPYHDIGKHKYRRLNLEYPAHEFNNQPAPPKVGVTLKESGTYTDFANINTGGITPAGEDGVNPVSYLILDCMDEMQLLQPSSNVQISRPPPLTLLKEPVRFLEKAGVNLLSTTQKQLFRNC